MSEKAPSINPAAEQAVTFADKEYHSKKTGDVVAHHVSAVDEHGNETHVSIDDMLLARGYDPKDPTKPAGDILDPDPITMTPEEEKSIYDEYKEAVEAEDTVKVKDSETGKMVDKKVKDLNFREWVKQGAMRDAARWYTATRSHGEWDDKDAARLDELDTLDRKLTPEEIKESNDLIAKRNHIDHQERLNGQENKGNPTEDDVDYYQWLKEQSGKSGEGNGEGGDDDEEKEKPLTIEEVLAQDELYQQRAAELIAARDDYAKISASRRKISTLGYKKELAEAKERYEKARNVAGAHVAGRLEQLGANPDQIGVYSVLGQARESFDLESEIVEERLEQADMKKLKPFYDWWARQGGGKFLSKHRMLGNLKKGLVVGALLAPGVALASPFLGAGVVAAGMIGAARGLARGHIDKNAGAALAEAQGQAHYEQELAKIGRAHAAGKTNFSAEDITEGVEEHTAKEVRRNRTRLIGGAAVGFLAPLAVDKIFNMVAPNPADKIMGDMPPKPPRVPDNPFDGMSINELEDFRWMTSHPEQFGNLQARASELQAMHPGWSPMQIRAHLKEALRSGGNINRS